MKTRILLTVSTLAIALSGTGCLLEPLSPEEEAQLRAEAELGEDTTYETLEGESPFGDPSDDLGKPDPTPWLEDDREVVPTEWFVMNGRGGSDPKPWRSSKTGSDNKPDPTPWRSPGTEKPDPTPWVTSESDTASSYPFDTKPDPTPWVR